MYNLPGVGDGATLVLFPESACTLSWLALSSDTCYIELMLFGANVIRLLIRKGREE